MTFVLIDNGLGQGRCCRLLEDPIEIVMAETADDVDGALARLEQGLARGHFAAGFFSYELGLVLEPRLAALLPEKRKLPLLWFGLFDDAAELDADEAGDWLKAKAGMGHQAGPLEPAMSRGDYLDRFAKVQQKIAAGDIYQMNLTFKSRFRLIGSPLSLYLELRDRQKVAYGALIQTDGFSVLSLSPELFIRRRGRDIETRPMKGTAARGKTGEADEAARRELAADAKQRAENLMIVDLMRNDLGRIAEMGSVSVSDLYATETYPTLHQMTSTVRARLRAGIGIGQMLKALFPPGSVTGAPKIRAMELIADIEDEARGVYTGAIGLIAPGGDWRFNVAIRTAVVFPGGKGEIGLGSGIVADSEGASEYAECLLKSKFFAGAAVDFQLIETMLYDGSDGYLLLERHMARLGRSARYFRFTFDEAALREKLSALVKGRQGERLRVRVLLSEDGSVAVTAAAQPPALPGGSTRYVLSPLRISRGDPFLFHKTTRRQIFDDEFARCRQEFGADEVVFLNERGELTEGSRSNIFIEAGGRLLTPALHCGLLPGTLRAELIESGQAGQAVLTMDDLIGADAVYLGNSVRGLMRAVVLGEGD